jgi:hypothetical protein
MQAVQDRIEGFQQWKEEQESNPVDEGFESDGDGLDCGQDGSLGGDGGLGGRVDDEGVADGLSDEAIRRMQEIQREILRFCIALLDHPLQDDEYKRAIISGLAVLMIKGEKERVRKIMQDASVRWMGRESILSISAWRQIAIAISRRFCRKDQFEDDQGKLEGEDGWDEDNTAGDDPWDLQAGHGTCIAGMIYAREMMEGNDSIISRREKLRRISQSWHPFLEFASSQPDPVSRTKRKRSSVEDEMDGVQAVRWKKLRTVDIQQALEDVCGSGAEFRGLQKPALEAIRKNESPVLVVMGTAWEDNIVPDFSQERGFLDDGGHHAIGIITKPYGRAVPQGRGSSGTASRSARCEPRWSSSRPSQPSARHLGRF